MSSVNRVILVGNLGRDAEIATLQTGVHVVKFSLATSFKKKNGEEETEWHRVSLYGDRFEGVAKYLTKGKTVYVEGRIKSRKYTDKAGVERVAYDIEGESIKLMGGGERRETTTARPTATAAAHDDADFGGDDIPF